MKNAVFNDCGFRLLSDDSPITIRDMKTFDRRNRDNLGLYEDITLKNMNVVNIHDIEYTALYNGSQELGVLAQLTLLPLAKMNYRPKELNGIIKIFKIGVIYNILNYSFIVNY